MYMLSRQLSMATRAPLTTRPKVLSWATAAATEVATYTRKSSANGNYAAGVRGLTPALMPLVQPRPRTPLQAPTTGLQPSHTSISFPLGCIDLYGNYSVLGPAEIRKVNNSLIALVKPGGAVSVLSSSTVGPTTMSCASLSHDDDSSAVVMLSGHHLELEGCFEMQDTEQGIQHDGKVIVSPDHLSDDCCITLLPGGSVSHPVNVHPQPRKAKAAALVAAR